MSGSILSRARGTRRSTPLPLHGEPTVSVLLVGYRMPRQLLNTVRSLTVPYQRGIDASSFEIVLVENESDDMVQPRDLARIASNVVYHRRREEGVSPAPALNEAFRRSRGDVVGIMVDGARMVTPGLLRNVVDAFRMDPHALVTAPGYHLGHDDQQFHAHSGYDEAVEQQLLRNIGWPAEGYRLFEIAVRSGANPYGFLHPFMESNALFVSREHFERIGGADERFDLVGGGMVNLDLYRRLAEAADTTLVVLPGEGSFHQFHGGVTTQHDADREDLMARFNEQYRAIRGVPYHSVEREPILLGEVPLQAMRMLQYSAFEGRQRFEDHAMRHRPAHAWRDDVIVPEPRLIPRPGERLDLTRTEGSDMSIYIPPSLRYFRPRRLVFSTWMDHIQFGYDLVEAVRPELLVELGTQSGLSYFTFCQSVQEHDIDCLCYAVDTWEGEEHTGAYDDSVYDEVSRYNRENYTGFSYLMRMLFSDALQHFDDDSVDLLHIDGLHTYEAVQADFADWYPKVKPGGIILFHDIKARLKDFGAWRFWEEVSAEYPSFTFKHGFGLGALRKPGGPPAESDLVRFMFESSMEDQARLRQFYVMAARYHDLRRKVGD